MDLCNKSENFVREARHLFIFEADKFSFNQNLKGNKPIAGTHLFKMQLHPTSFSRNVSTKIKDKNDYIDIDLEFLFLDLSLENREILYKMHKRRKYVVILASNIDMILFGNDREPMSISVDDNIVDNASGKDAFKLKVTGQTIIIPRQSKITEPFRVLFFLPPLE